MPSFLAKAPGKVILSGEHAVVHGGPAVVLAVRRFATVEISPPTNAGGGLRLHLENLKETCCATAATLKSVATRLAAAYTAFLAGKLSIRDVVRTPKEVFFFACQRLLEACAVQLPSVTVRSDIPMGCGMGSSAATAVSFAKALAAYACLRGTEWLEGCIGELERLLHGRPSGVDAYICLNGGCRWFRHGSPSHIVPAPSFPIALVNTGTPLSTTGESVSAVAGAIPALQQRFERVTEALHDSLLVQDEQRAADAIRENHRLLRSLGVVPDRVDAFVEHVERVGGAAKVCGAGAVRGSAGGIVLVQGVPDPGPLCSPFGYSWFWLEADGVGATVHRR